MTFKALPSFLACLMMSFLSVLHADTVSSYGIVFNKTSYKPTFKTFLSESAQHQLCTAIKKDDYQSFFNHLEKEDILIQYQYRQVSCKQDSSFSGGSLISAADHFGAQRIFQYLIQSVATDDIFWEKSFNDELVLASKD